MKNTILSFRRWLVLSLVLVTTIGASSTALAQNFSKSWTTVGSAGTVDEQDTSIIELDGPVISLAGNAPSLSYLDVRYNVVPVDGLFSQDTGCYGYRLKVRYRDEFNWARLTLDPGISVRVELKSIDVSTGAVSTLLSFYSDSFSPAYGFQTQVSNLGVFSFDFGNNAYWVEAQLIGGDLSGIYFRRYPEPAAIASIQIVPDNCLN